MRIQMILLACTSSETRSETAHQNLTLHSKKGEVWGRPGLVQGSGGVGVGGGLLLLSETESLSHRDSQLFSL